MTVPARTLVDLYRRACDEHADEPALGRRTALGWVWLTYSDLLEEIDALRAGLFALGVRPADRVAIVSDNRPEWPVIAYACSGLGAVLVPLSEHTPASEWQPILAHSRTRLVIASRAAAVDALEDLRDSLPLCEHVVGIDLPREDPRSLIALSSLGLRHPFDTLLPDPRALAELVYTEGAGPGAPAPLALTHERLIANVRALQELSPIHAEDTQPRCVATLPWTSVLGRLADLHHALGAGAAIAIHTPPTGLFTDVAELRPTQLTIGPALLRQLYQLVIRDIWQQPAMVQRLFHDALAQMALRTTGRPGGLVEHPELFLDEESIFDRLRERLGGRITRVLCSGALCHEVAGVLQAMDVEVVAIDARAPIDDEGHLALSPGRSGYTLTSGVAVLPAPLEEAIKLSAYVHDAIVVGEGHRHNVALIVPEADAIAALARRLGVPLHDPASDAAVLLLVAEQMRERLEGFPRAMVPRRFAMIAEPFSIENGLLTPLLELRRDRIAERYAGEIRALYRTPPPPPRPRRPRTLPPDVGRA
jgi:long-subunit acyl-CoA synthetase (AMP-forming)